MKVLYGAGNTSNSNIFLSSFLNKTQHEIKILAFYKNHQFLHHIDWTLDPLKRKNAKEREIVFKEIKRWKPELVISDVESVSANIADTLGIELWYCSPLLLLLGMEWEKTKILNKRLDLIKKLPAASKYLISSPFCDIIGRPILKNRFEWVKPYISKNNPQNIINLKYIQKHLPTSFSISSGETSYIADIMYNEKKDIAFVPHPEDDDQILNVDLAQWFGFGFNFGQTDDLQHIKNQLHKIKEGKPNYLNKQNIKELHEII